MGGLGKQWLEVPDTGQHLGICVVGAAAGIPVLLSPGPSGATNSEQDASFWAWGL